MKTRGMVFTIVLLLGSCLLLYSQTEAKKEIDEAMKEVNVAMDEVNKAMEEQDIVLKKESEDYYSKPFMGVYFEDLTLKKMRELNYNQLYGILITGIIDDSPAKYFRLLEDDIIMKIGNLKVMDRSKFVKIIDSYYVGDKVQLTIFRNGEEKVIDFMFGARNKIIDEKGILVDKEISKEEAAVKKKKEWKKKLSVGHGGGSWIPVWFVTDLDDVNDLVTDFELSPIKDNGIFMNGGGGKGLIGKGLFIGGMGAGYSIDRKKVVEIDDDQGQPMNVTRRMKFNTGYGGVTLDKRFAISSKIITSLGFMLGWGGHELNVSQIGESYIWDDNGGMAAGLSSSKNNYINIKKSYILFQPKLMLMFRLTRWLGIRGEAGYMMSYSYDTGWKSELCGDVFEIEGSPDTTYEGYTISIGPWFGF